MNAPPPNPLADPGEARAFIQSYWQRQPAVIRDAVGPAGRRGLSLPTVLRLAQDDMVESRLVQKQSNGWQLTHGPLESDDIPALDKDNWTLLVQGVDLHLNAARHLLDRFRFIPDARVDDLMISIAGNGGGVGPHTDDYDVFLLQLRGKRRWALSAPADYHFQDDQPLKLIDGFQAETTHTLNAGDMLYLPAGWAHDGIADGPCMTASIGYRAPARNEVLSAWLQELADQASTDATSTDATTKTSNRTPNNARYRDPQPTAAQLRQWHGHPARVPNSMMQELTNWLRQAPPSRRQLEQFVGQYLTEPKAQTWFDRHTRKVTASPLRQRGVMLDRRTRMLWHGSHVFINGESIRPAHADALTLLRQLADDRQLDARTTRRLMQHDDLYELVLTWYETGWIQLMPKQR